jgi:hypothetical protein
MEKKSIETTEKHMVSVGISIPIQKHVKNIWGMNIQNMVHGCKAFNRSLKCSWNMPYYMM